ncbi:MAG TPA: sugar transferase [Acidimicrobiia bacterium]|nr:sugar transferase [Acidimicrobiia bacterium]
MRTILLSLDVFAIATAWLIMLAVPGEFTRSLQGNPVRLVIEVLVITVASVAVIASQRLYLARVCGVRAVENARLARASAVSGVVAVLIAAQLSTDLSLVRAGVGAVLTFVLLSIARGMYTAWLKRGRTQGRFCRPVVLVGAGSEAEDLYRLVENHPELGYRIVGVVGPARELHAWSPKVDRIGDFDDVFDVLDAGQANSVILATSDVPSDEMNQMTRALLRRDVHVHLSSGLRGIAQSRIRALPLAHEPLFYLEAHSLAPWQRWVKRLIDLAVSGLLLVLLSPILVAAAIAVKLGDRGPVLFRQERVGLDGRHFTLFKMRTMVADAEARFVDVSVDNQRTGPLFKLARDPRRTRVGHILERTSIDELPQLINVLRGEMSLVGPRPALPHEVEQFDEELLDRQNVAPGITGLWQAEGRDNPEFDVYRRLDLFYVENWSVSLDLAIILATAQAVIGHLCQLPMRKRRARRTIDFTVLPGESTATS